MKIFFTTIIFLLLANAAFAQEDFAKVVQETFRVNPFSGTFSSFTKSLATDPELLNKEEFKQTDSTGYYLKGEYNVFNPFSINANKVDVIFNETEIKSADQKNIIYYNYQIVAYFDDTLQHRNIIKKEYEKLRRRIKRDLYTTEITSLKNVRNIEDGEITNFFNDSKQSSPAILSWQTVFKNQVALTLLLRLVQYNNYAYPLQ